jgi:hypothetical protein
MAGTKIVEVRAALTDALAALPTFADSRVAMTWKADAQVREQVFTTRAQFTHEPASMKSGRTFRKEDGEFDLVILVTGVGEDATWSATRAVELGTVAEEWIADHRSTLGVAGVNWLIVKGEGALTEMYADRSTLAELTYHVTYEARLT